MGELILEAAYGINGLGVVITGTITQGTLSMGETLSIGGRDYVCSTLESDHKKVEIVTRGNLFGSVLKEAKISDFSNVKGVRVSFGENKYQRDTFSSTNEVISKQSSEPTGPKSFLRRLFGK
jgi:GTPase